MPRSLPLSLIIAFLWLLLIGGYLLTVPLSIPLVVFSRIDIALLFSDLWNQYWGTDPASLDQFFSDRLDLWSVGLAGIVGIWTTGRLLLRLPFWQNWSASLHPIDANLFAYGVGLSVVTTTVLVLGLVGLLSRWFFWFFLALPALLETLYWLQQRPSKKEPGSTSITDHNHLGLLLCTLPFLLIMFLSATQPPLDFDVREYHLEGPKEYFLAGRVMFLEHNVYTNFPALTEMVSLLGMVLRGDWYRGALIGKFMLMPLIPLTAVALGRIATRLFGETSGWLTALVWLSIPWSYTLATVAYVEGGMLFFLALTMLLATMLLDSTRESATPAEPDNHATALLLGLLSGGAMACKYPGLVWGVLPAIAVLLYAQYRLHQSGPQQITVSTMVKPLLIFSMGVLITVGPWLFRNVLFTGNPFYPLVYGWFGGREWTPELHSAWQAAHAVPEAGIVQLPSALYERLAIDFRQSPLLLMFAPLVFLRREFRKPAFVLLAVTVYLSLTWWFLTHRIDRFWLPCLLPLSLLAGGGFVWDDSPYWYRYSRVAGFTIMGVSFALMVSSLGTPLSVGGELAETRKLAEQHAYLIHLLNEKLEPGTRVLLVGEAQVFDAKFEPVYNTVFNKSKYLELMATPGSDGELKPTAQIKDSLQTNGIEYIAVNWEEILRYRMTYGFPEAIVPAHLQQLVDRGILGESEMLWGTKIDDLSPDKLNDLKRWAPELIQTREGQTFVIFAQVYRVL